MFRNSRPISSLSRSFFRYYSSHFHHDGYIHVQRVRFIRPIFTFKRIQTASLYASAVGAYWHYVIAPNDDEEGETGGQPAPGKEREIQDEAGEEVIDVSVPEDPPEDAIFVPLGLTRQRPPTLYKASDPEWQSFVEFSRDKKRSMAVRNELAGIVGHHISALDSVRYFLGSPIQTTKYWLDIDFPEGPPPEYERSGLEITDDYIAWTTRPVEPLNISRLRNVLWPTSMTSSLWVTSRALWSLQIAKFKDFFNIKSDPQPPLPQTPAGYIDFQRMAHARDKQQSQSPTGSETSSGTKTADSESPKTSSEPATSDSARVFPSLPSKPQPGEELNSALSAFKRTLARTWKPAMAPAPRGTFTVSGLVQIQGPKGVCLLDVRAAYHPKDARWDSVGVGIRRMQALRQTPKGGK